MENLKIRVNSEAESKEAQELFFDLDYVWFGTKKQIHAYRIGLFFTAKCDSIDIISYDADYMFDLEDHKEITLPELRDLVVLKRNNAGDATHTGNKGSLWYLGDAKYGWRFDLEKWELDDPKNKMIKWGELKPIEKPMKEYLDPENGYKLNLTDRPFFDWIEIPEGCNIITCENRKGNLVYFHWKSLDSDEFFLKDEKIWSNNFNETLSDFIEKNEGDVAIIWSRHTLPEELPFIDDEPKIETETRSRLDQVAKNNDLRERYFGETSEDYRYWLEQRISRKNSSLNDQYAEIEKVRQSAWQKQEGGSHYKNLKIQPMQYALENKLDYAQANVVKYVTRHKEKNGKEDLLKAIHNIEPMIEFYYGDEK